MSGKWKCEGSTCTHEAAQTADAQPCKDGKWYCVDCIQRCDCGCQKQKAKAGR